MRPSPAVVLLSAATAFSLLGDQVLYAVLPVYFGELGLTALQVGMLLSANRWIRLLTNELAHRIERRFDHRLLLLAALGAGAGSTAAYVVTGSFAVLLAARLVWGLCWSFIRHIGVRHAMVTAPSGKAGATMGVFNGITRTGSVAGLFGGALLVDYLGFVPALLWLAAASLLALPLAAAGLARAPGTHGAESEPARDGGGVGRYAWLGFALGAVGPGLVMSTLGFVLASYDLDATFGAVTAATVTGALLAVRFVLDGLAAPFLGGLSDRFGMRRSTAALFAAGALALAVAASTPPLLAVCAMTIVFFVAGTGLSAGIGGTVARLGSARYARFVTANDLGAAAGPAVGWLALDLLGRAEVGLALGAAVYALAGLLALTLPGPASETLKKGRPARSGEREG